MPFQPGQSGNLAGRPKVDKLVKRTREASLKRAWMRVTHDNPRLLENALINGLNSYRNLGYLELGAKLMKEIGAQEDMAPKVIIQLNSSIDINKLASKATIIESEPLVLTE